MVYFKMILFSSFYPGRRGFFSDNLLGEHGWLPWVKSHKIVGVPLWLGVSGVFNCQIYPYWASNNSLITVQVFLSWHFFLQWFPIVSLCFCKLTPYMSTSQTLGQQLSCVLPSLRDPRKIFDFPISLTFYLLG